MLFDKGEIMALLIEKKLPIKDRNQIRSMLNHYIDMHNRIDWDRHPNVPLYVQKPLLNLKNKGTITVKQLDRLQAWARKTREKQEGQRHKNVKPKKRRVSNDNLHDCTKTFKCGKTKRSNREFIVHKGRRIYL